MQAVATLPFLLGLSFLPSPQEAGEARPVKGAVIEVGTQEPLAAYAVRVRLKSDSSGGELLWTDESGQFETAQTYEPNSELMLTLEDHPEQLRVTRTANQVVKGSRAQSVSRKWDPDRGPLGLRATVGPSFRLELSAPGPIDIDDLVASLEASEQEPWGPLPASHLLRTPLRAGGLPWARFAPIRNLLPMDRSWILRVESRDGLLAGEVEVPATTGVFGEALEIQLAPAARLEVTVRGPLDQSRTVVHLLGVEEGRRRIMWPLGEQELTSELRTSRFELLSLPEGAYRLEVGAPGSEPLSRDLVLVPGATHQENFDLLAAPAAPGVRGELRSRSGDYREPVTLYLEGKATGVESMRRLEWKASETGWRAEFDFEGLPPDTYRWRLYSQADHLRWEGLLQEVTPSAENLVLECLDTLPVRTVLIAGKDAQSGEMLRGARASMSAAGCASAQTAMASGAGQHFGKVPIDATFDWWVAAEGYKPRFGDESMLVAQYSIGRINVALSPGWGARLEFREEGSGEPIGGLGVKLDGESAGVSDIAGRIDLESDELPARVDLDFSSWSFVKGDYDMDRLHLRGAGPIYTIVLREQP